MLLSESKPSEFLPHFFPEGLPDFEESYYFNARWYDPITARFITEDPVRDSSLWYAYVNNNPMKFVDPTGMWATKEERQERREERQAAREERKAEKAEDAERQAQKAERIETFNKYSQMIDSSLYDITNLDFGFDFEARAALELGQGDYLGAVLATVAGTGEKILDTGLAYLGASTVGSLVPISGNSLGNQPAPTPKANGIPIKNNSARNLLRSRGATKQQARQVIDSFDGQIYATQGRAGEVLTVTETSPGSASGLFTTRGSAGATAAERIKNLALPTSNTAAAESQVFLTRPQTLLEGRVASQVGNPGFGPTATGGGHQVITDAFNGGIGRP